MKIDDPGGNGEHVEHVWVFLVQHGGPNDESTAAMLMGDQWFPLVSTTDSGMRAMTQAAQKVATLGGKPVMLARFDNRTDLGLYKP